MNLPSLSRHHVAVLAIAGGLSLVIIATTVAASMTLQAYNGRILPGIRINGVRVGGLTPEEATDEVQRAVNAMVEAGVSTELYGEMRTVPLVPTGATDPDLVYPFLDVDVDKGVMQAMQTGRQGKLGQWFGPLFYPIFRTGNIEAPITLAATRFAEAVRATYPNAETPGMPTDFAISKTNGTYTVSITPPTPGAMIDIATAEAKIIEDARDLRLTMVPLQVIERSGIITVQEAEQTVESAINVLQNAPYTLEYKDELTNYSYTLTTELLEQWLAPMRDEHNLVVVGLNPTDAQLMLTDIRNQVEVAPQNAAFAMEGTRVTTFTPGRNGLRVDDDALLQTIADAFKAAQQTITIPVAVTAPDISTAASNTLGINELLGTGYSAYKGSPTNRRANIAHGLSKLNGTLIAPGETFSLLAALRPFTVADGYLPELVIKGDEIKPEVGGGLCQIGSTTFRAAMNSGLEIAERRNHSLVVNYYNDPSNNKPGTDATIYDPAPDLKITNDTAHYVLLQTENRTETSELFFHFWGTSDGRQGSYTPPEVLSWTGYGAKVVKETDKLPPGKQECQSPHPGATTTFTYIIEYPDGTKKEREFRSTYRSLPQICLVGKASATTTPTEELIVE
jgi:vancomycin resistance protein YoaR